MIILTKYKKYYAFLQKTDSSGDFHRLHYQLDHRFWYCAILLEYNFCLQICI